MKIHTSAFKENIKKFGRELDSIITFISNNEEVELGMEELNSVTPHYEGALLKSVMKVLDIDSNVDIPIGTELNYQFGVKVGNSYEYLDFGNLAFRFVNKFHFGFDGIFKCLCYTDVFKWVEKPT